MNGLGRHRRTSYARRRVAFAAAPPSRLKRLRVGATVLLLVTALAVAAAWFGPRFLDWGQYRAAIESVASAGLGRAVRIAGPIRLSLLPQAALVAGDVTLPDIGDGVSATATQLRLQVVLSALLAGRIEPQDLVLRDPHMRLPWPLTSLASSGLAAPAGLHARVEDGTLAVGSLQITAISGELRVDPATGSLAAAGLASVMGRPWQMTGRLGRAGDDGSATLNVSLDGAGSAVGTGGTLSGQIAADGGLTGRISARGPDLSLLLPAPARPWQAAGQVKASGGLVVADDLELTIGGSPAKGAVAIRLLPQPRLDAALATSRLDLGAWLTPLLQGSSPPLPTGIELSADAAQLAGGTLQHLRTGFEVSAHGVTLREAEAELPGGAMVHVSGQWAAAHFNGSARLSAPNVPQTLAWLRPRLPAVIDAMPADMWRNATLTASVAAEPDNIAFTELGGDVDGVPVMGEVSLQHVSARPALTAKLQLMGPTLDRWLPRAPTSLPDAAARLAALPQRFAGLDGDVSIVAAAPVWHGVTLDQLVLEARCSAGTLELRRATMTGKDASLSLVGVLSEAGHISGGRAALSLAHTESLGNALPPGWEAASGLFHGPLMMAVMVDGPPDALALTAVAEMSDGRVQLNGALDLPSRHWKGGVLLHHPGAPRLLYSLGLGDTVDWLGDGSLSLQATADAATDHFSLSGMEVSAGLLRASGDLAITGLGAGQPLITGKIDAETLPLPQPNGRSGDPWSLTWLRAANVKLALKASHLLWKTAPIADDAAGMLAVTDGAAQLDGFRARVANGSLAGQASLDASAPPRLSLSGSFKDIMLDGPLAGVPGNVVSGHMDGSTDLSGSGYSPAGVLATLAGSVQATVQDGALTGLDAGRIVTILRTATTPGDAADKSLPGVAAVESQMVEALGNGATPFSRLDLAGTLSRGTITLGHGEMTMPAGSIAITGNLDLPSGTIDTRLALRPALETAPSIGLRLIGPVAAPSHSPELADLARWLADR